ncbi:PP2C family protein-serine/threonine phosphatase [Thalassoglobus sp.]|uniref:PP2C family protein-serine/threonine phosphatase n=1 Tax=Thalassoglobus sp. TaxID=2795869 RepID=UPI003AA83E2B
MDDNTADSVSESSTSPKEASPSRRWSISTQLLLSVNSVCAVLLLLFVAYDYQRETRHRLNDKRQALTEEAIILHSAVREIQHHGADAIQAFIDATCARMSESLSPGHHIIIKFGDQVMQAQAHHRSGKDLLQAVEAASIRSQNRGDFKDRELIVGTSQSGTLIVYVSEFTDDLKGEVSGDTLRRLGGSVALGLIAAFIVNVVMWRVVVHPIERLIRLVETIADGEFGDQVNGFRSRELSYFSRAINRMSKTLARNERQRQSQLEKARRIQQNLLPVEPSIPNVNFAACYEPAEGVAGDFYDVRQLKDGSWIVFMADVTGHGIPAAMSANLLKAHLAEGCEHFSDALEIIHQINVRFTELTLPGDFATAILLRYLPDQSQLQVVNAGHDAAVHMTTDAQQQAFDASGLLLGVDANAKWKCATTSVSPGDRLLMYTDGVTETFDVQGEMFGRARVLNLLQQTASLAPQESLNQLAATLEAFRSGRHQLDDVTAILIEF